MKEILIVVPSRSRPELLNQLLESWEKTTSGKSFVMLGLDINDPLLNKYPTNNNELGHIVALQGELNKKNNLLCNVGVRDGYDIIGCLSDDFIFHTPGWEEQIIEWQHTNKGICYGNDLLQGGALPTAPFIHRDIISALGYAAPPELIHYYIDNYWMELGMRLNKLKYFPEIIIEHRHWSAGKAPKDEVYSTSEALMGKDAETWSNYRQTKLAEDVKKIQSY